jgi:hypothetical protein
MRKTDEEIKKFIDNNEVLTVNELEKFIYNNKRGAMVTINRWWGYVLETKDWVKLREYREKKILDCIKNNTKLAYEKFVEIYNSDIRFKGKGFKSSQKILNEVYGYDVGRSTVQRLYTKMKVSNGVIN